VGSQLTCEIGAIIGIVTAVPMIAGLYFTALRHGWIR
jgi:hypothetical protein